MWNCSGEPELCGVRPCQTMSVLVGSPEEQTNTIFEGPSVTAKSPDLIHLTSLT